MSAENVGVVQRIWDLYEEGIRKGDLSGATGAFDEGLIAPDSTFTPVSDMPGSRTYVGREGFVEFLLAWVAEWDEWSIELERVIDAGDDRVLAIAHQSAIGKGSGAAVEARVGMVYTLKDGQVVDRRDLWVDEAFEAVGLSGAGPR
jgi:ketosteroid isomerase-like protein